MDPSEYAKLATEVLLKFGKKKLSRNWVEQTKILLNLGLAAVLERAFTTRFEATRIVFVDDVNKDDQD